MAEAGAKHDELLLGVRIMKLEACLHGGRVLKVLDTACGGARGCMWEKSAPFPGPCQAFAANASGARMAGAGRAGVYLDVRVSVWPLAVRDMVLDVGVIDDSCSVFGALSTKLPLPPR